ncbi:Bulb-type lectin domain containing protein [Parasponia andersonii]|uniref:Bulb-type lectin domain containing protein n=1 Tax=Parasponia andersonii TaxID=3476 RepID=A0A2P5BW27_PARAD|nr:Bulb-type lectin domain containing protein [Parasponia andersonii]
MALLTIMLLILLSIFCTDSSLAVLRNITPFQYLSDDTTLVSKEGSFELGFFTPESISKNHYMGIWYKNVLVRTVIWLGTGNNSVVWSRSLAKQAKRPKLDLLDSRNLVVTEEEDTNPKKYLWQSFDYTSDTMMPGMKFEWDLRTSLNRCLSAWKNWDDPCSANFTYGIEFDRRSRTFFEAVIQKESVEFYRTGPWNGLRYSDAPDLKA